MYLAGVLTFFVALGLYVPSRRSPLTAAKVRLRGFSYLLLGIALILGAEGNTDALSWLLRVFGAVTFALGSRCLISASAATAQPHGT